MSEEDSRERRNWKTLVVGSTASALLAVSLVRAELLPSPSNVVAGLFVASPENSLRILQSVGVLLPLFVGLLRFTTRQSEVGGRLNDHLLLGILGLVFAGAAAVIAGLSTAMNGILKLALLFVLFTFVLIGLAAGAMLGELSGTGGDGSGAKDDAADEEIDGCDESARLDDETDGVGHEADPEPEGEPDETDEQAENPAK